MLHTLHKMCAYPQTICWVIATITIWIPLTIEFSHSGIFSDLLDSWSNIPLLFICYTAFSGLGFFLGALCLSWFIYPLCRSINGAPHKTGEQVMILSGPHSGYTAQIYEITAGQGGQPLPRLDLGIDVKESYQDIFEDYELLRLAINQNKANKAQ